RATQEASNENREGEFVVTYRNRYSPGDDDTTIDRPIVCLSTTLFRRCRFAGPGAHSGRHS
ncbi:hypothetical protein BD311DRAFT_675765, partial [Dichomitus squalens]